MKRLQSTISQEIHGILSKTRGTDQSDAPPLFGFRDISGSKRQRHRNSIREQMARLHQQNLLLHFEP